MPIFRHQGKLYHYAHVPKCAGIAVERYLEARFGRMAFLDDDFNPRPRRLRWTNSSAQHVAVADLATLVPPEWIEGGFAVVRNPVARFASAYNFCALRLRWTPPGMGPEEWFEEWREISKVCPFYLDNHLRPQTELVPEGAKIFRLEDGLDGLPAWLDDLTGETAPGLTIERINDTSDAPEAFFETRTLSPELIARIEAHYQEDYERFGFETGSKPKTVYVPTRKAPAGSPFARQGRGKSLAMRRAWRRFVSATGIPLLLP